MSASGWLEECQACDQLRKRKVKVEFQNPLGLSTISPRRVSKVLIRIILFPRYFGEKKSPLEVDRCYDSQFALYYEIYPGLSLVELLHYCSLIGRELQSVATPALLCHKEPARRIQSPLLGALGRKIPPLLFCLLLAGSLWHKRAGVATL